MAHDADGIRELDNKLPRWWVWLLYGTMVFAVCYMAYYHVFASKRLSKEEYSQNVLVYHGLAMNGLSAIEYQHEMAVGNALKAAAMSRFEATFPMLQPSRDPVVQTNGGIIFQARCAMCHRKDGGGLVGPDLCDDYWIHGSNFADNVTTIWNGVPAKGMITWKNYLKPDEVYSVASYIYTFRGTHPVNPKPPENQTPVKTGPSEFE